MSETFSKTKQRYITCGIQAELDISIIQLLWELIEEEKKNVRLDYLQVIRLTAEYDVDGKTIQQGIVLSQEQPPYHKVYRLPAEGNVINDKIFLIDEPDYSTMTFAREY